MSRLATASRSRFSRPRSRASPVSPLNLRSWILACRTRSGRRRSSEARGEHGKGRHPPFADRDDGDQRIVAEGRRAHGSRGDQQSRGRPRQEDRADRRGPGVAVRRPVPRKGEEADRGRQGRRHFRLLDLGEPEMHPAGHRAQQRAPLLPGRLRRERVLDERDLCGADAESADHSRDRMDPQQEGGGAQEDLLRRLRLRVSADGVPYIARKHLKTMGIEPVEERYVPFGHRDFGAIVQDIKRSASHGDLQLPQRRQQRQLLQRGRATRG